MNCPKCNIEMTSGKVLNTENKGSIRTLHPYTLTITSDNLTIIDCLKCSECGHSDDGAIDISIEFSENE